MWSFIKVRLSTMLTINVKYITVVFLEFAGRLLNEGITPRNGSKSDQAHPPIHPTKYADNLAVSKIIVYFMQ